MADTVQLLIFDANVLVAAAIAFTAGLVSFASPCVVPLVPGYLSFMTGLSGEDLARGGVRAKSRVALGSVLFVLGFAVPFVMMGSFFAAFDLLARSTAVRVGMGVLVIALGLLMASGRLMREVRFAGRAPTGLASAPALGFVFGVGWTPCIGPALGAIFTISASVTDGVSGRGAVLGFVYALGLGVPFIVFGLAFRRLSGALDVLRRNARSLQIAGGSLLALVGLAIATGLWDQFIRLLRPLITGFEPPI